MIPRGIRNNNPGNIVLTDILWKGKIPNVQNTDRKFEQFIDMPHGIHALIIQLRHDIIKDYQDTVRKIIEPYASPNENDTSAYIKEVTHDLGIDPDDKLMPTKAVIDRLVKAVCSHENGNSFCVSQEEIDKGWELV